MENKVYNKEELFQDEFKVLGADEIILKNHNNKSYSVLSENISRNLIGAIERLLK